MNEWSNETKVRAKKNQSLLFSGVGDGETSCFDLARAWWTDLDIVYGIFGKGAIDLIFWKINPEKIGTRDLQAYHWAYNYLSYVDFSPNRNWCLIG